MKCLRKQVLDRIMRVDYRIPKYPKISAECKDLIQRILVGDPDQRLTIEQIQRHPWCALTPTFDPSTLPAQGFAAYLLFLCRSLPFQEQRVSMQDVPVQLLAPAHAWASAVG